MKLFKYEGYKITISEEALMLKPFKALWDRDKTKTKEKALMELGYIYFLCDPRSDYQYIVDLDSRSDEIKKGEGIDTKWKPDSKVMEAIEFYNSFKSAAALLLEDIKLMVDGYRNKIKSLTKDMDTMEVKDIKDIGVIIKQIPSLIKDLDEAEKSITKELAASDKVRGKSEKSIYEDL